MDLSFPICLYSCEDNSLMMLARSSFVKLLTDIARPYLHSMMPARTVRYGPVCLQSITLLWQTVSTKTSWPPFHPSIAFYNRFNFLFCELRVLVSVQVSNLSRQKSKESQTGNRFPG